MKRNKNVILLILMMCFGMTSFAQTVSETISSTYKNFPIVDFDFNFKYLNSDTVEGLEVYLYNKNGYACNVSLIFIEKATIKARNKSLRTFFEKADTLYHYTDYNSYYWLYNCFNTEPDTFYYCRDETLNDERNFKVSGGKNKIFYRLSKTEFFAIAEVNAVVDRFISNDTQISKYFYHFQPIKPSLKKIEKVHYNVVLNRVFVNKKRMFKSRRFYIEDLECIVSTP